MFPSLQTIISRLQLGQVSTSVLPFFPIPMLQPRLPVNALLPRTMILRVKKEIAQFFSAKIHGITILPMKDHIGLVYALIFGPKNTPYEGGLFLFLIAFPPTYPQTPLIICLLNNGNGTVRFGPNILNNGSVCLSILNTWPGPNWTPDQNLTSVLISVQSLLNQEPYFNEPGFTEERSSGASKQYNKNIAHETLRCAVCDILEKTVPIPDDLHAVAVAEFRKNYQSYIAKCESNLSLSLSPMIDSFSEFRGMFQYDKILLRLQALKKLYID